MTQKNSRKWLGWDVAITALVFGLVACDRMLATDAYTALVIQQVQVLDSDNCTVPGAPTGAHRTEGVFDVALPDQIPRWYSLPIVVANNMPMVGATSAEEMNNITLTHFTVELSAAGVGWTSACPAKFDTPSFSFTIEPGGTTGASLDALTPAHSACLRAYVAAAPVIVTAKVWAKGRHGGTSIESSPLVFPITVCAGCLQMGYGFPELVDYSYPNYPPCAMFPSDKEPPFQGDVCLPPGQDAMILCCGVTSTYAICPAVGTGEPTTSTTTP